MLKLIQRLAHCRPSLAAEGGGGIAEAFLMRLDEFPFQVKVHRGRAPRGHVNQTPLAARNNSDHKDDHVMKASRDARPRIARNIESMMKIATKRYERKSSAFPYPRELSRIASMSKSPNSAEVQIRIYVCVWA